SLVADGIVALIVNPVLSLAYECEGYRFLVKTKNTRIGIISENDELIEELQKLQNEIKEIRRFILKIELEIALKLLAITMLVYITYFVCLLIVLSPIYNSVYETVVKYACVAGGLAVGSLFYILVRFNSRVRKMTKNLKKYSDDNNAKRIIESYASSSQTYTKAGVFSDDAIISYVLGLITVCVFLFTILPLMIKGNKELPDSYLITAIDGVNYSVIYVGKDEAILKKCMIDGNKITIDSNSFIIQDLNDHEFEKYTFSEVNLSDI
ncbi:MAG: hypothetical protein K6E75_09175, partial [Lachnospiraceae bacterium]|nr:hypothetical protein [Lachnospiraceae bacterium]